MSVSVEPNIMTCDESAKTIESQKSGGIRWRTTVISSVFLSTVFLVSSGDLPTSATANQTMQPADKSDQSYYANAHPYLEEPLNRLVKRIPQLKKLRPAPDQRELPVILAKTGERVDDFFRDIIDLTAQEAITQEWVMRQQGFLPPVHASERVRDSYLILRSGHESGANIVEYRADEKGNRLDHEGLDKGYFVTSGFALICNYFSTGFQSESKFRYLGDETIGARDTYVVGFAQQPGKASLPLTMKEGEGKVLHMLLQGIAWVDKNNFQIIRMRTDLLAPRDEIGLNQETVVVTLSEVQLLDVATPLWLPSDVKVSIEFRPQGIDYSQFYERTYRNEHHYTNYRHYRVSVKILSPK